MSEPNKINGLLTQKPDSPVPHVGEAKRYSITPRISKTGKEWNKVKAEGEGYGKLFEVISVAKTDFVDSHGNISFNVDLIELVPQASPQLTTEGGTQQQPPKNVDAHTAAPSGAASVHSTSTNGSGTPLEGIATNFFASLGKADDALKQFFDPKQVSYEFWADKTILVACHFNNKLNK